MLKTKSLAITGLVASSFFIVVSLLGLLQTTLLSLYIFVLMFSVAVQIGCWTFLLRKSEESRSRTVDRSRLQRLILLAFFVVLGLDLLVLHSSIGVLPLSYFLLFGTLASLVSLRIFLSDNAKGTGLTLALIFLLSVLSSFSFFIVNPYPYGSDVAFHYHNIIDTLRQGAITGSAGWDFYYPIYTIYGVLPILLSSVPVDLFGLANFWLISVLVLFVFLIARSVFGGRAALFAAVLMASSSFAVQVTPSTIAVPIFAMAIFSLVKAVTSGTLAWHAIFWLFALTSILVHPAGSMALLAFLGGFAYLFVFHGKRRYRSKAIRNIPFIGFLVAFVGYTLYVVFPFFVLLTTALFPQELTAPQATTTSAPGSFQGLLVSQLVAGYMSYFLLTILGTIGFLLAFSRRAPRQSAYLAGTVLLIVPIALGVTFGRFNFEPERGLAFVFVSFAVLGGLGLSTVRRGLSASTRRQAVLIASVVFFTSSLGAVSYLNANGNQDLSYAIPAIPAQTTASTLIAHGFVILLPPDSTVYADLNTMFYILGPEERVLKSTPLTDLRFLEAQSISDSGISSGPTFFIINTFALRYGTYTSGGARILGADFAYRMGMDTSGDFSLVYRNGVISIYQRG